MEPRMVDEKKAPDPKDPHRAKRYIEEETVKAQREHDKRVEKALKKGEVLDEKMARKAKESKPNDA
jgi:hypothetical protein